MSWGTFFYIFFLTHVKFLFAPTIATTTIKGLSFFEIFLPTALGALFCFNIFFFTSRKIMNWAHEKRVKSYRENKKKVKKSFTKKNKLLVKIKQSKGGFVIICVLAPLFLSIPIGTIVVSKFYGKRKRAYALVSVSLIVVSFLLTYLNDKIFNLF